MMFWRKQSDGFEWHKYVRTTIKLRRDDRRRRIDEVKHAAVDGLRDAGRAGAMAGASGLAFLQDSAKSGSHAFLSGSATLLRSAVSGLTALVRASASTLILLARTTVP